MHSNFAFNDTIYSPADIEQVLDMSVSTKDIKGSSKKIYYYNVPCAFDIETSSFYIDNYNRQYTYEQLPQGEKVEKIACMYVWQFGINGNVIVGRTWEEFVTMMNFIADKLELNENRRLIIYVHNLSYEFQFISRWLQWDKVFSIDIRKPIYGITTNFIEFRCSYLLSGYNLEQLGKHLTKYKVEKKVGDLDYRVIRHSETLLTSDELGYCINDVKVVMAYIQEKIEELKGILNLPLTKTGFVRKYCRGNCLFKRNNNRRVQNYNYIDLMNELQIGGLKEFDMLQRAFVGGFTHANARYTDQTLTNVSSYDFTSSYPAVMISEKYPMSKGVQVQVNDPDQLNYYLQKYCCIFDIEFNNIQSKCINDNPLSASKCYEKDNVIEDNGRVVSARRVKVTITNVDYEVYKKFYTWGSIKVGTMYCYRKAYLPTEFVKAILELYGKKTTLKGVKGAEVEYLNSKEMLNSCYGMSVTNPLREEFVYENDEWSIRSHAAAEKEELILKYNESKNRFLFYPWGIFVTAYARRNLFTAIHECGNDYLYSDTDSVKILDAGKHQDYFNKYNSEVARKLQTACKHHNIDFKLCKPKTIKGVEKLLGEWDYEGTYEKFKTLGAKRYMVQQPEVLSVNGKDYDYSLTVSGVNKNAAIPFLVEKFGDNIFDAFTNYLYLPPEACGKNIHTYIDYELEGEVVDYDGVISSYHELSAVHLEPTDYNLNMAVQYLNYIKGIKFHAE